MNYIANKIKAQRSFGKSTSIETLEKKLIRGAAMSGVEHIESAGLQELYGALRRKKMPNVPYEMADGSSSSNAPAKETEILVSERALARLQSLFLYGEDAITEKVYLMEKKRINDEIESIDARLNDIEKDRASQFTLFDEDFIEKASFFILSQQLTDNREVNYTKFIRKIDLRIVKEFLRSIIQNFCIKNGRVESIRLKNGMEHVFSYRS